MGLSKGIPKQKLYKVYKENPYKDIYKNKELPLKPIHTDKSLESACEAGHVEIINYLLSNHEVDLKKEDSSSTTFKDCTFENEISDNAIKPSNDFDKKLFDATLNAFDEFNKSRDMADSLLRNNNKNLIQKNNINKNNITFQFNFKYNNDFSRNKIKEKNYLSMNFFQKFINLSSSLFSLIYNKEERSLKKTIQSFIDNSLLNEVLEAIHHGYILDKKMDKELTLKLKDKIYSPNSNICAQFNYLLHKKVTIADKHLISLLFSSHGQFLQLLHRSNNPQLNDVFDKEDYTISLTHKHERSIPQIIDFTQFCDTYPDLVNTFREKCKDPSFQKKIFNQWHEAITICSRKSHSYLEFKNEAFQIVSNLHPSVTASYLLFSGENMNDYLNHIKKVELCSTALTRFVNEGGWSALEASLNIHARPHIYDYKITPFVDNLSKMKSLFNLLYNKQVQDIYKTTAANQEFKDSTVNDDINKIDNSKSLLPENVRIILQRLQDNYQKIQPYFDVNFSKEKNDIDNIMSKKVPQLLEQYLSIDPIYRNSLINSQSKTSEESLLTSLKNIEEIMNFIFEQMNQNKVSELSATERYTQEIKRSYSESNIKNNIPNVIDDKETIEEEIEKEINGDNGNNLHSKKLKI